MRKLEAPKTSRRLFLVVAPIAAVTASRVARADSAGAISRDAAQALRRLYAQEPHAHTLGDRAVAILVFPKITKAGLVLGGEHGVGALFQGDRTLGYYSITAGSVGLQIGAETFSYALFFMNGAALKYLYTSGGWSVGTGPSVVVLDKGKAASVTSATLTQDVYAIPFGQSGLMAGLNLGGSKISRITPS